VISSFRRQVDENCAVLGYYTACSGNFLPTFGDNLSVPSSAVKNKEFFEGGGGFFAPEDETDRLSRKVGKKLSLLAA